ncbi:MAG: XTP/dITP diphosphatase [Candidatus Marinimicrobia bacterium]|nr:XTP/dITP diphosphatase [Candidatus Neomarinimicrobiota bacterium]
MKIVIASGNEDKISEIRDIFQDEDIEFKTTKDYPGCPEVVEDGNNLFENAFKKAKEISEYTGLPAISDDTGLEVDALDGRPGVYSARYAGENATYADNVEKLLKEMKGVKAENRTARFRTVCVFYNNGQSFKTEGIVEGRIITTCRGENGFGYDPVFYYEEEDKTFAEMSEKEKNMISHRGQAIKHLYQKLKNKNILKY